MFQAVHKLKLLSISLKFDIAIVFAYHLKILKTSNIKNQTDMNTFCFYEQYFMLGHIKNQTANFIFIFYPVYLLGLVVPQFHSCK